MRDDLIRLTQSLVQAPSVTGDEAKAQEKLAEFLKENGLQPALYELEEEEMRKHPSFGVVGPEPLPGRPDLSVVLKGGGGRSLLFNGHIDVVDAGDPGSWHHGPWSGDVDGNRLYGRGSLDMKGGVAAAAAALVAVKRSGIRLGGNATLVSVIGEESGGVGTLGSLVKGYRADAAIIAEPTQLQIIPAQCGALTFRITVPGLAAHGAARDEGVSAIEKFYVVLKALLQLEVDLRQGFNHPLFAGFTNPAPLSVGTLRAGVWHSSVADYATAEGRYGVLVGESVGSAKARFEDAVAAACRSDEWLKDHPATVTWIAGEFAPCELRDAASHPLVQNLQKSFSDLYGTTPVMAGVPYGSDLRFYLNDAQMPAVLCGPGDVREAHAADESIDVDDLLSACRLYAQMLVNWCGLAE
jgi:acetylornithine deacetylase